MIPIALAAVLNGVGIVKGSIDIARAVQEWRGGRRGNFSLGVAAGGRTTALAPANGRILAPGKAGLFDDAVVPTGILQGTLHPADDVAAQWFFAEDEALIVISNMRDDHELERVVFTTRLADGFAVELPEGYYSLAALIYDGHEDEPEGGAGAEGIAVHAESHTLVELGIETRGDGSLSDTLATHAPSIPARLIAPDGGALPLGVVTTIGRASESVIVIDDPTVSRHHAVIEFVGDGYVIHDLASSNGTFLNGYRVQQSRLQGGDVVRVGSIELLFRSR